MDWFVRRFVKASLAWFGLGITLGVAMAIVPRLVLYRPAHVHMNLLGFVTMMIYGVAYHVIPRFTGHPLYSRRLAGAQWWISNAGLALMAAGFVLVPHAGAAGRWLLGAGGLSSAIGGFCFIANLWRTIDGPGDSPTSGPAIALQRWRHLADRR
jgi:heme/copper-type cytochrome/quinol oxidase subunit 1